MKLILTTAFCFSISFLFAIKSDAQSSGSDQFFVLPMAAYSSDLGLGFGGSAAWQGIGGSSWTNISSLFVATQNNLLYISSELLNKNFLGTFYVDAGISLMQSERNYYYGSGNTSDVSNRTQYGINDGGMFAKVGVNIVTHLSVGTGIIYKTTGINRGSDPGGVPQYLDMYPNDPNHTGTTMMATTLFILYDTRQGLAPQSGDYAMISVDQNQPWNGTSLAYQKLKIEALRIWVIEDKTLSVLTRGRYEHIWGNQVPFFLESRLGGQSTLRGYVSNRFVDSASQELNIEPRWSFWNIGGSFISRLELNAGLDFGRVFNYENIPPLDSYHLDWDIGLTAITPQQLPIRLDYAISSEGPLFYLHLFYPF